MPLRRRFRGKNQKFLRLALLLLLTSCLLRPELALRSAESGLSLWWRAVVPALLPFFITSELLLALGAAEALGRPLEPLVRPVFRLPGAAALGVVLGFCSGFPAGALLTAGLYREGQLTQEEAQRLLAFTNNAGPLYLAGSLAAGLLGCPRAALPLLGAHYGADLVLGWLLGRRATVPGTAGTHRRCAAPWEGPPSEGRPFGALLREAAQRATGNLLLIGGYMAFFSVLTGALAGLLPPLPPLVRAWLLGSCEMSLGVEALTRCGLPPDRTLAWMAAMVSFGGLSVQAQVLAMVAGTGISPRTYLLCRPFQAGLAYLLARLLCRWVALPAGAFPPPPLPGSGGLFLAGTALCLLAWLGLWAWAELLAHSRASQR